MNIWVVFDERNDEKLITVAARSESEAEQLATEFVAESGLDRELDYDGFWIEIDIPF